MYNERKFYRHIGPVSPEELTYLHNQKMVYFSVVSIALVLQYSSMYYWELVAPLLYMFVWQLYHWLSTAWREPSAPVQIYKVETNDNKDLTVLNFQNRTA